MCHNIWDYPLSHLLLYHLRHDLLDVLGYAALQFWLLLRHVLKLVLKLPELLGQVLVLLGEVSEALQKLLFLRFLRLHLLVGGLICLLQLLLG